MARTSLDGGRSNWEARIALRDAIYDLDASDREWADAVASASAFLVERPSSPPRRRWQRDVTFAAAHLSVASRLRRALDEGPGATRRERLRGRILELAGDAPAVETDLWEALSDGHCVLVDRFDLGGRRYFVAARSAGPALVCASFREKQVAQLAARGLSNQEIAFEVGFGASTSGTHLGRAMAQLGLSHRSDLPFVRTAPRSVRVGSQELLVVATQLRAPVQLSAAEVEVARLAARGESDRAIAAARGSSPRTVANQLRSVYRKLRVASRTELALELRVTPSRGVDLDRQAC